MNKLMIGIIWTLISLSLAINVSGKEILMSNYIWNGIIDINEDFGSSKWSQMNAAIENGGNNVVTLVENFENLTLMLSYDALWLQIRGKSGGFPFFDFGGSLSQQELDNIRAFISTGKRVVLLGEWGGWPYDESIGWQSWDNQILSIVGGSYNSSYGDAPVDINPVPTGTNPLTDNVNSLEIIGNRYGTSNGGLALFEPNIATLWGTNLNVLTVLDTGVFSDYSWDNGDNKLFAENVAKWITTTLPKSISINIRPWSKRNPINYRGHGILPVAILSTEEFDAPSQVDQNSLTFGATGNENSLAFCNRKPRNISRDGSKDDLVCHFFIEIAGFKCGDTEGILNGMTTSRIPFEGNDLVRIINCK